MATGGQPAYPLEVHGPVPGAQGASPAVQSWLRALARSVWQLGRPPLWCYACGVRGANTEQAQLTGPVGISGICPGEDPEGGGDLSAEVRDPHRDGSL